CLVDRAARLEAARARGLRDAFALWRGRRGHTPERRGALAGAGDQDVTRAVEPERPHGLAVVTGAELAGRHVPGHPAAAVAAIREPGHERAAVRPERQRMTHGIAARQRTVQARSAGHIPHEHLVLDAALEPAREQHAVAAEQKAGGAA